MNLVILHGVLNRPVERKTLESGTALLALDVTVRTADGPAEAVPVSWFDPPATASSLDEGTEVVVLGRVHRRFYRVGGRLASRTDVAAERVVAVSSTKRVRRLLVEAQARLDDVVHTPVG